MGIGPVSAQGTFLLAAAGDWVWRVGLSDPSRGHAGTGGPGGTLLLLPLSPATRINWPRWWRAIAFLAGGLVLFVGPYIALKGGVGTKPGIARVLGLAPRAEPLGLERERPLPPDQTNLETYRIATIRMLRVFRAAVTPPLFPLALFGVVLAARQTGRARTGLLLAIILAAAAVRLCVCTRSAATARSATASFPASS